jgi:hypothetical protein
MHRKDIPADERRLAKRVPLNLRTRIRHSGLEHGDLTIRDLSFTGFQGETGVALKRGDLISVALPNIGLVRATVKWRNERSIAGEFQRPVDVRICFRDEAAAS